MCGNEEDARDVPRKPLAAALDTAAKTGDGARAGSFCTKARRRGAGEPERHESLESVAAAE